MIPATFTYLRPSSLAEAIAMLGDHEDAKLLAGGHSLLPLMKLRLAAPATLIDLGRLEELSYVRQEGDEVAIGAMTRHHAVATSTVLDERVPLLAHAAGEVGDPQVRHRGTLGGSVVHGDPASDLPATVLALGGTMVLTGPAGTRRVPAEEFFLGFLETACGEDEILTEVRVPVSTEGYGFEKFTRRAQDWAIVGVAVARRDGGAGIGLVNMAPTPVRAREAERALASGASAAEAAGLAGAGLEPSADTNASSEYRLHLATVLTRRALEQAGF